ncbi:hypothetical protein HYDPIDRAFT_29806 [Hydnomerulius pinastri MD-312]|uniref:Uncharacterized protein n=1 Tax=Hydnomerulius pinastri MD-312 TaxID=994086 RepID=A0A0C9WE76_9AGAM|nr:hypothetical protein HYDPIDRAFT_29806 [Hydnomerulius pinastri MD-312]
MSSQKPAFLQALKLSADLSDDDCTQSITDLIGLAAREQASSISLRDIHDAVDRYKCAECLNPLDIIQILLPSHHDGADELMRDCALYSSPKEVVLAVQTAIELLQQHFNGADLDGETDEPTSLVHSLTGMVSLCTAVIPRLKLGKRTAQEWCSLLSDFKSLVTYASPLATRDEGRSLISEVAHLVKALMAWKTAPATANDFPQIKVLLCSLLDTTVVSCASSIQASLAARVVESYSPRFSVRSAVKEGWQDGEKAMLDAQDALAALSGSSRTIAHKPESPSDLVYLAHSTPPATLSPTILSELHPLLLVSLQMNVAFDESLFLLFRILTQENTSMPPEIGESLCTVLPALASTHLDPFIRQFTLRLVSLILSRLPSIPRLEILRKLTADEDFPQIRGPAIGLLKEAVLEALTLPADYADSNPFASQHVFRAFGNVLFKTDPPDFFAATKTREELESSLELLRISDCLSFYYVLLQRDRENKTGVRDADQITNVESSFLQPLRQSLDEQLTSEEEPLMAVLSLQLGLDRIDDAIRAIDSARMQR